MIEPKGLITVAFFATAPGWSLKWVIIPFLHHMKKSPLVTHKMCPTFNMYP